MDTAFWQRQLDAFLAAPLASLIFLAVGAVSSWWLRGTIVRGEVSGLRERVAVLEERLRLASEQAKLLSDAREQLQTDLEKMREQIYRDEPTAAVEATRTKAARASELIGRVAEGVTKALILPGL